MATTAVKLATTEAPLTGKVEPRNDEVIAVFRNGKLEGIWAPGGRARPLWLRYKTGSLTYSRILRSDIGIEHTVPSVVIDDGWCLPSVSVSIFIALNAADGYRALRTRLEQRGLDFLGAVTGELSAEVDSVVREVFRPRSHAEVDMSPTPAATGAGRSLLRGLFVIDSLRVTGIVGDPAYLRAVEHERESVADQAATARARINAEERGLSIVEFENPELLQANRAHAHTVELQSLTHRQSQEHLQLANAHDLQVQQLQAGLESQRIAVESARIAVESERVAVESERIQADGQQAAIRANADVQIAAANNAMAVDRAIRSGSEFSTLVSGVHPAGQPAAPAALRVDSVPAGNLPAPDSLAVESKLRRHLAEAGLPKAELRGAVLVESEDAELAVVVVREQHLDLARHAADSAFASTPHVVLSAGDDLDDWVAQLVAQQLPGLVAQNPSFALTLTDAGLDIIVQVASGKQSAAVRAIVDDSLVVVALDELLPFAAVTVK